MTATHKISFGKGVRILVLTLLSFAHIQLYNNYLSMKLGEARTRNKLSAEELAKLAGISASNIYAVEYGAFLPSLRTVKKLAQILGVDPMEIEEFKATYENNSKRLSYSLDFILTESKVWE